MGVSVRGLEYPFIKGQLLAQKDWTKAKGSRTWMGHFSGDEADPFVIDE